MLKRVMAFLMAGVLLLCSASGLALTAQDAAQLSPEETDEDLLNRYLSAWEEALATDYKLVMVSSYPMVPGMEDFMPQGENIIYVQEGTEAAEYLFASGERDFLWYDYYLIKVLKDSGIYDGEIPDKDTFAALVEAHYGGIQYDGQLVGEVQTADDFVGNAWEDMEGDYSPWGTDIWAIPYDELLDYMYNGADDPIVLDSGDLTIDGDTLVQARDLYVCAEGLSIVEMPDLGIRHIGEYAFIDTNGVQIDCEHFYVAEGVETIGQNAFSFQNMRYIHLPDTVTDIDTGAFSCCDSLQAMEIPAGVTRLNSAVFVNCEELKWIIIPESVTEIADDFVYNNSYDIRERLVIYGYAGTEAEAYAQRNGLMFEDISGGNPLAPDPDAPPAAQDAQPPVALPETDTAANPAERTDRDHPDSSDDEEAAWKRDTHDYAADMENRYPKEYKAIEDKLGVIDGWSYYHNYIYKCILQMDDIERGVFMKLMEAVKYKSDGDAGPHTDINRTTISFDDIADSSRRNLYEEYDRWYQQRPDAGELERVQERDITTAFFHEMGHAADTDAGGRLLKNFNPNLIEQTVLHQDDEAINIFLVDSANFLYNELLKYTDAQTAMKIAINTVRGVQAEDVEEGALSEEEQQIRDKALASIQKDGIENYDEMYTSLDAICGAIEDEELRDNIAPRCRAEYYNDKIANPSGSAKGVAELWAHYFSARMRGDTAEIAVMRKIFPNTITYFETQVWTRVVNENY